MIQSAMMFALGVCVSGLLWLAIAVILVRRARRLTERRLLASVSTRRVEFETERDELRARHAMQMHRLEKEVSRGLDAATAYRLDADIKERDLVNARADVAVRDDDYQELQGRLAAERDSMQDLERRHAEAGAMLRAVQHALTLEVNRRTQAQAALADATAVADRRRVEVATLQTQVEGLRAAVGKRVPVDGFALPSADAASEPAVASDISLPDALPIPEAAPAAPIQTVAEVSEAESTPQSASVVPLPTRSRQPAAETAEESAALVWEAAQDLQRIAGEGHGDFGKSIWRAPAHGEPRMPPASALNEMAVIADLDAHRTNASGANGSGLSAPVVQDNAEPSAGASTDSRFFEALAEIRALRRAAKQAGE